MAGSWDIPFQRRHLSSEFPTPLRNTNIKRGFPSMMVRKATVVIQALNEMDTGWGFSAPLNLEISL